MKFTLLILFLGLMVYACKNPLEDITIKTKDAISTSAIRMKYFNANTNDTETLPPDMTIKIVGLDADKIVNSVGGSKITYSKEGLLGIAVSPNYLQRPLKFSVVAEARNYYTSIREFMITDQRNFDSFQPLYKISNLPAGVAITQQAAIADNKGLTSSLAVKVNTNTEIISWNIQNGTTMKDQFVQNVSGKMTTVLTYYDGNTKSNVPNAYTLYDAKDLNGKTLKPFDFHNFCFFQTEMFNENYQKVDSLSNSVTITIELNDKNVHSNSEKIKVGDKIMLWGYLGGVWRQLAEYPVKINDRGKFEISAQIVKMGYYTLGEMFPVCEKGPMLTVKSDFHDCDIYYLAKLVDASKGTDLGSFFMNVNDGAKTSLAGRRANVAYLQVFDFNAEYGGVSSKPIFQSAPFDLCSEKLIEVKFPIPQPQPISIELVVQCPLGKTLDESDFPAEMYTQYRLSGSEANSWKDLFRLTRTNRKLITNKLQLGKKYILRSTTNPSQGWPFLQKDTTISQTKYVIKLNGEQYCK
jgi:hypothetical protein